MDYGKLSTSILGAIENRPGDIGAYEDLFSLCQAWAETDFTAAHRANKHLKYLCAEIMGKAPTPQVEGFYSLWRRGLLFEAPYDFDSYLTYIELDRKLEKRFYQPRKHYLKRYVDAYQKILDGELDFLSISMPKRAGKSQLGINFTNMLSGKFPEKATLMEGTGDDLVNSFYKGCLEYLQTPSEYLFYDVFPESKLVQTNADTKTLNLMNKSRFPTIMCRSIDARQVGLSEATNLLYLDDCVEGREEAKNRQRLDEKWEVISGDIIGRAIEGTPIVICGTRYSLYDPIGRLQEEMKKQNKRCEIIETPALDLVTDESNFEYIRDGKKVFTTQYFRDQRDMLSAEQFESEFQQQPFEAKGLLFPEGNLNRFFELPVDKEPDTIIAACDTADKGADYCAMPIAAVYGQEVYIIDVVFDDSTPEVTKPEVAKALINNKVVSAMFESNNAGSYFARDVQDILKSREYMCSIRTKRTISNKQTRIEFASDNILKHFYFKHPSTYARNSQYAEFMQQVTTYTRSGKVAHDDGADSLSLLENELRGLVGTKVEVFARPF
jgi:predicted phage terminase large subunit-like protein